jgi:carboxyl-terminal processing protease
MFHLSSSDALAILLDASLKGAMLLAAAGLLALACRRGTAAARHLIWSLAIVGVLSLPILSMVLPSWRLPVSSPLIANGAITQTGRSQAHVPGVNGLPGNPGSGAGPVLLAATMHVPRVEPAAHPQTTPYPPALAAQTAATWSLSDWIVATWIGGALLAALQIMAGWASLLWLRLGSRRLTDNRLSDLLHELTAELGLRRNVVLLQSHTRLIPMTWGLREPVILLPEDAETWSPDQARTVLLHELVHVKRWDCLTQLLGHCARALYWFNPLAWLAVARLRAEQEQACDDGVLNAGSDAADYAEHLLTITAGRPSSLLSAPVALAMGKSRRIERRLLAILDVSRSRRPLSRRLTFVAGLASLCLVLPLASLTFQARAARAAAADTSDDAKNTDSPETAAKKLVRVQEAIRKLSAKDSKDINLTVAGIRGMLAALEDPYAEYYSPDQAKEMDRQVQGMLSGIGAQLQLKEKKLVVVTPLDDSPALKAGVQAGDVILAIDGRSTEGLAVADAVKLILGPKGSKVKLKISREGSEETELTITRAQLTLPTVLGFRRGPDSHWDYFLDAEQKIGYVRITQFAGETAADLRTVVEKLKAKGLKGLILDLRFCPGGMLKTSLEIANLFLSKGKIVAVKDQAYEADGKSTIGDFPVVVLVNEYTASAAEIVAGALLENDRAKLVGTRTYGKGAVQQLISLENGSGTLKLTAAYYRLPSGRNIDRRSGDKNWGVDPSDGYYVPMDGKQTETLLAKTRQREIIPAKKAATAPEPITLQALTEGYADPQLAGALKTMAAKLSTGEFTKIGKDNTALLEHVARREAFLKQREVLRKSLEKIDQDLKDLDKRSSDQEKR